MNEETVRSEPDAEKPVPSIQALRAIARLLDELPVHVVIDWMRIENKHQMANPALPLLMAHRSHVVRYVGRRAGVRVVSREPEPSAFGWRVVVRVAGPLDSYVRKANRGERSKSAAWVLDVGDEGMLTFDLGRGQIGGEL